MNRAARRDKKRTEYQAVVAQFDREKCPGCGHTWGVHTPGKTMPCQICDCPDLVAAIAALPDD